MNPLIIEDHTDWVHSVTFSPDGKRLASASCDGTIRIWDVTTGKQIKRLTFLGNSIAFSPDGSRILIGSSSSICLWDAITGKTIGELFIDDHISVLSVAYSRCGDIIASGSDDGTIYIWDSNTWKQIGEPLVGHTRAVRSLDFSYAENILVSGSDDKTIRIWDVTTGEQAIEPLTGHNGRIYSVAFSPDGSGIVSSSSDKTIRIWNLFREYEGTLLERTLLGHTDSVISVAYSPDGSKLVSSSEDRTIRIWDAKTGKQIGEPLKRHSGLVTSVSYSPDESRIASGSSDGTIQIWDISKFSAIKKLKTTYHETCKTCVNQDLYGTDICSECKWYDNDWTKPDLSITKEEASTWLVSSPKKKDNVLSRLIKNETFLFVFTVILGSIVLSVFWKLIIALFGWQVLFAINLIIIILFNSL